MKLIRCYIENFGGLHHYSLEFQPGLTVVQEENGFGKTTLAAFLRCMFYGMPRSNKGALEKDLRRKYAPWQGGRFGGTLEFQVDGEDYRLERTFGDKPSGDSFLLYRQPGLVRSSRFSKDIGLELFGLDGASFERSTYIPQTRERLSLSTDGIQAGLNHLVEDNEDVGSYQRAVEVLRRARTGYQPYRGTGGLLEEASRKVAQLEAEIEGCQKSRQQLDQVTRSIQGAEARLEEKKCQLNQAHEALAKAIALEQGAAPGEEAQLAEQQARLEGEARALIANYPKGLPPAEKVSAAGLAMDKLTALEEEEPPAAVLAAQELLEAGNTRFCGKVPDEERLKQAQVSWAQVAQQRNPRKASPRAAGPLLALGAVGAAAGIVLLLTHRPVGIGGLLVGLVLLVSGLVFLGRGANKEPPERTEALRALQALLGTQEADPVVLGGQLTQLSQDCAALWQAQSRVAEYDAKLQQLDRQRRGWEAAVEELYTGYQLTGFSRDGEGLHQIAADLRRAKELEGEYRRVKARREKRAQAGAEDSKRPERSALEGRIAALDGELSALHQSLAELRQSARTLTERTEGERALRDQLDHWRTICVQGQRKAALLDRTISYLEEARQRLSECYLDRLQGNLTRYLARLWPEGQRAQVNHRLEIQVEEGGVARELAYFSAGSEDLITLCMRLALVDTLFAGKEKPILILDDPFVNLDEKNTARALDLIHALAEEEQILYLVCHSSRV